MQGFLKFGGISTLCLLFSCGAIPTALCPSTCGARMMGVLETGEMPEHWTCEDFQHAENMLVYGVDRRACAAVRNVEFYWEPGHPFYYGARSVAGVTFCDRNLVILSSLPPNVSAYAHEVYHLIQGCAAPLPVDEGLDSQHANWNRANINADVNRWHLIMKEPD